MEEGMNAIRQESQDNLWSENKMELEKLRSLAESLQVHRLPLGLVVVWWCACTSRRRTDFLLVTSLQLVSQGRSKYFQAHVYQDAAVKVHVRVQVQQPGQRADVI